MSVCFCFDFCCCILLLFCYWVFEVLFDFWVGGLYLLWMLCCLCVWLVVCEVVSVDVVILILKLNCYFCGMVVGQYVNLGVEVDGCCLICSYSFMWLVDGMLVIIVKVIDGGCVSQYLVSGVFLGEVFELGQVFGGMILFLQVD